jgi:hypothetical protein
MKRTANKFVLNVGIVGVALIALGALLFHEDLAISAGGGLFVLAIVGKIALALAK